MEQRRRTGLGEVRKEEGKKAGDRRREGRCREGKGGTGRWRDG